MNDIINKVHHADCLEFMRGMPDKSVDLVLTDPPYGIGENNQQNLSRWNLAACTDYGEYRWDAERIGPEYIREAMRVSKNQIIFGGNYYTDILPPTPCWIFWDKKNGNNDFADGELAWGSFPSAARKFEWMWNGMLRQGGEPRYHPTGKPVALGRWIVERYSKPTDTILDPFMGAGSFIVAAKMLGRRFIGIDIEKKYCDIAEERLRNTTPPLPFTVEKHEQGTLL
jgi:DNA modification methylase